jgi:hypothetical protein
MKAHPLFMFGLGIATYWAAQHFFGLGVSGQGRVKG